MVLGNHIYQRADIQNKPMDFNVRVGKLPWHGSGELQIILKILPVFDFWCKIKEECGAK